MRISKEQRRAARMLAEQRFQDPEVTMVGVGFKWRQRVRLKDAVAVVVGVERKLPLEKLTPRQVIPATVLDVQTDVVETGVIAARQRTEKRRPCPPGYSLGHTAVTAGTLGAYVRRDDDMLYILSNNHVIANSNAASEGDDILQPGSFDNGTLPADRFAELTHFVQINFGPPPEPPEPPEPPPEPPEPPENGKDKKPSGVASAWWKAWKALPNATAALTGCPRRLVVSNVGRRSRRRNVSAITQPFPNRVDAALALPLHQSFVDEDVPIIGELRGFVDLELGDDVHKLGRTTDYTTGSIEIVEAMVKVQYDDETAPFDHQLVVVSNYSHPFSAGGDSGSGIYTLGGYLGGLLFAGGRGDDGQDVTIANPVGEVARLLGVRA